MLLTSLFLRKTIRHNQSPVIRKDMKPICLLYGVLVMITIIDAITATLVQW